MLPMDTATFTRVIQPRPNLTAGRTVFTYAGEVTGTPNGNAPNVLASSYNIKAEVEIPEGGAEGILVSLPVSFLETPVNRFYRLDTQHLQARDVPENQEKQWAAAAKRCSVIVATQYSRQSCFISFSILKAIWHICLSDMCFPTSIDYVRADSRGLAPAADEVVS